MGRSRSRGGLLALLMWNALDNPYFSANETDSNRSCGEIRINRVGYRKSMILIGDRFGTYPVAVGGSESSQPSRDLKVSVLSVARPANSPNDSSTLLRVKLGNRPEQPEQELPRPSLP